VHAFFDEAARQIGQYDPASDELLQVEEVVETFIHWPEIGPLGRRIPPTLQAQVGAEWREGNNILDSDKPVLGAWEVSVPAFMDPEQHILSNTRAVSMYFHGLEVFHNPITHTVRPILPLARRMEGRVVGRPVKLIEQFFYASAELGNWVAEIKRRKEVISLERWMSDRSK
jgi:hypothetical protein